MRQKMFSNRINSSRVYLNEFISKAASTLPESAVVLDAGAGNCPYKPLFQHVKYEAADFCEADMRYASMDYVCDLASIPVADNRYDFILCSQVLEHVPEPEKVLEELYRVLKPGGELFLSVPLFFPEHGVPYDFYRFTQFGLHYLLEKAEFQIQQIEWLEGYCGTLAYQLDFAIKNLPSHPRCYGGGFYGYLGCLSSRIAKPFFRFYSNLLMHLDLHHKITSSGCCKNYVVKAVKA